MSLLSKLTATSAAFGPFVSTTGVTLLSTKTILTGRSYKNGTPAAFTPASWAADTLGMYVVGMNTTHTDTTGRLRIYFGTTGTGTYAWLPVWRDFDVGATSGITLAAGQTSGYTLAAGQAPTSGITLAGGQTAGITLAAGQIPTSGITLAGGQTAGITLAAGQTAGVTLAAGQTAGYSLIEGLVFTTAQIVDAVWDEVLTGATHNVNNSAGKRLRTIDAGFEVSNGTARAGTSTTITLAADETATDDLYNGDRIVIVGGTGQGEHSIVTDYDGTSKVATMSKTWVVTPDATSEYEVIPADTDVETWNNVAVTGDGDWNELQTAVDTIGGQTSGYSLVGGLVFTTAQTADAIVRQMVTASAGAYANAQAFSVVKQIADNAGGAALTTNAIAVGVWQYASGRTVTTSGITLAGGQTSGITLAAGQTAGITLAAGQTAGYSLIEGLVFTTAQMADAVVKQMVTASAGAYSGAQTYSIVKQIADNAGGSALTTATISGGVWQYATRTLTQTGASVAAAVAGSELTITKWVDYDATLTSLGNLTNRSRLWLTMKDNLNQDADADAILMVELTSGALYINKAAATSASYGSLSVSSDGTTWNLALFVDADATGLMGAGRTIEYDVKMRTSTGAISQVTAGKAHVRETATRATS